MARPLRIEFAGALYHVTSRGNARADIFLDDSDRRQFLDVLRAAIERYGWLCHAYSLMPNHYHLLVCTPEPNLSRGMRQLNGVYTQRFNRQHERVGHVFQGRFHAVLVEREAHLITLARYIVLNPVRAGMVATPEAYAWSSLRGSLGLAPAPGWLSWQPLLTAFGSAERYLEFVREGAQTATAAPWAGLKGCILGSSQFVGSLRTRLQPTALQREIRRAERLVHRPSLAELFPSDVMKDRRRRDQRIRDAIRKHGYTLAETGRHLDLHYVSVGRIARAGEA